MRRVALGWMFTTLGLLAMSAHAADTVYYYSSDTLHSEVVVTDQSRNVVERTYYAPYGQVLNRDLRDGPGYTGHEEDPETGLVYMQQRYYDPETGQFLSTDPVGVDPTSGGNFNRYAYAKDNPYRYTDPFGMQSCTGSHIAGVGCDSPTLHVTFFSTAEDIRHDNQISQEIKPASKPLGGSETVSQIAGRVNNETLGMKDSKKENETLQSAKVDIALVRLNAILKWGKSAQTYSSMVEPKISGGEYKQALKAVQTAIAMKMWGIDPTNNAVHYNMRTIEQAARNNGNAPFLGFGVQTKSGPYVSPSEYKYIFTYGNGN